MNNSLMLVLSLAMVFSGIITICWFGKDIKVHYFSVIFNSIFSSKFVIVLL